MTFVVCAPCFGCKDTDCVTVCPVDAFREGENMLYIDPDTCIDCNECVPACPEEAIFADVDVPSDWAEFTALNAEMAAQCPEINTQKDPLGGEHCEKKE